MAKSVNYLTESIIVLE